MYKKLKAYPKAFELAMNIFETKKEFPIKSYDKLKLKSVETAMLLGFMMHHPKKSGNK